MICPRCGSRTVIDSHDYDKGEIEAECESCGHSWTQPYNPNPEVERKVRK